MAKHTAEEVERFAQEYVINEDNTAAYLKAKPNSKAASKSLYALACKMSKLPAVAKRIEELKAKARDKAETRFNITVEQRLKWLKQITEAGLGTYHDQGGNERRENLAASRAAIATMNDMLGTDSEDSGGTEPLEIKFTISTAKGKIETTNVESD